MQTFTNIKTGKQVAAKFSPVGGEGSNRDTVRATYWSLRDGNPFGPVRGMVADRFHALHREG